MSIFRKRKQKNVESVHEEMLNLNPKAIESFDAAKHRQRSIDSFEQTWPWYRHLVKSISHTINIPSDTLNNYVRTIGFLLLLGFLFPFNLLITIITLFSSKLNHLFKQNDAESKFESKSTRKRILISGGMMTKALVLCRGFHQAGHQIILVDEATNWLTGHRWSKSVERFYVVPSPEKDPEAYIQSLVDIVQKEKIDMFVPVTGPYHAHIDAQVKAVLLQYNCSTFHMNSDEIALVDNKYSFTNRARSLDLPVPKSFYITSRRQLLDFNFEQETRPYICKSIMYDWLDRGAMITLPRPTQAEMIEYVNRLPINEECPYILQEFIQGDEYCTHGTCLNGELTLFTCCHSSSWQLTYKHIDHPSIEQWCRKYVREMKLTGHASFDFIVSSDDGKAYGIECNPRVHSAITAFYNHPNLADAYLPSLHSRIMIPLSTARETYWLTHELWRIIRHIQSMDKVWESLRRIFTGREAIWSFDDPLPFLLHYHVHIVYLLLDNLRPSRIRFFHKIDCCLGELA
ncbi:hypothetical protein I4U23_020855 [Adineta vaga]|nr:hypothetical protein I4U23_020855 [Adineta vaga]